MEETGNGGDRRNLKKDVIARCRQDYFAALAEAEISAAHTDTEGWQKLYANHRTSITDSRRRLAKELRNLADQVEAVGTSEDSEKEIGELKKECANLRESDLLFELQTIEPVRAPASKCEKIIADALRQAYLDEHEAPMVNVGLEEMMRIEVSKWKHVEWNDLKGRIIVASPAVAEAA